MYLKALEIQGFKSFPDKTVLSFDKDITAIVGPNGSGKSNIADALLWVMGEQRSKALRGGKMEDVIFGGTEKRGAMGFAQVSLILDNSERLFDMDSSEVMITRRYYRSGESEYYINRESVRLRDITELLMDTGLGRDGYSIIGQGRIADIISARSTDRREIFEEAAGIARFRARKEEAERKLEKTDENLLRVNDKIDELELQVGPLKKQAEDARKYLALREELKQSEVSAWMAQLDRLHEQSAGREAELDSAAAARDAAKADMDRRYAEAENFSAKMREQDMETEQLRQLLSAAESRAAECDSAMAVIRTNIANNAESVERMRGDIAEQLERDRQLSDQLAGHESRLAEIEAAKQLNAEKAEGVAGQIKENEASSGEAERALSELISNEGTLSGELTQARTVVNMLADSAQELMDRETACARESAAAEERRAESAARLADDRKAQAEARGRLEELTNMISGYRLRLRGREQRSKELGDRHTKLMVECRSTEGRLTMLENMEREYEGFSKAVKTVMRESERGTLRGVHGPVASLVRADERFALALETAVGAAMQNIVVDSPEDAKLAIELLKRRDGGRATFLPLSSIRGSRLDREPEGERGYLGLAIDLAQFDREYESVFTNLLGRTAVAETLGDAVRIAKRFSNRFRIVTLDGQVINAGGSMTGGSAARGTGVLSRANEIDRLRAALERLRGDLASCEKDLGEAERALAAARHELEAAQAEQAEAQAKCAAADSAAAQGELIVKTAEGTIQSLSDEKRDIARRLGENRARTEETRRKCAEIERRLESLRAEIAESGKGREGFEERRRELEGMLSALRSESASLDAEAGTTQRAMEQLRRLRESLSEASGGRSEAIAKLEASSSELGEELASRAADREKIAVEIASLKEKINSGIEFRLELEGRRVAAEKAGKDKNAELVEAERLCSALEQKKLAADMEEKQIIDKLWDSYELSRSAAQAMRSPVENMAAAQKRIAELRRSINALGTPNLGAIDEYARVSERYGFLTEQRDDVEKAKRELLDIISQITREMKDIFIREFKEIDRSFRETFLELFGGGRAALILEDEDNVLDCGIEVKVQPPGKALSTLSLLSGGEKAFVAIALYYAIIKVHPTPFCVMDEIEAALDDVNVIRSAEYMRTLTKNTQFIVITHRRGTMEQADVLYGVTMQEKGVSKVIEMDIDEAEKALA